MQLLSNHEDLTKKTENASVLSYWKAKGAFPYSFVGDQKGNKIVNRTMSTGNSLITFNKMINSKVGMSMELTEAG